MRPSLNIDLPEPEWLVLLKSEKAKGKSVSQIARECGMARPSVSMLLNGTYPAQSLDLATRKHGARIVQLYRDRVLCPHLHHSISSDECRAFAAAPMSTSMPEKLRHWSACRKCDLNPVKGATNE
ncbi:helix-turn-helix domain-containing protein [Thalassovita sp.]|uniref:MarR family transcriptional regulator n=1 Tax=Thalassovita sp. TaxID=1979401 RepID=UPI002B271E42|nr:helix-turn-helix domain-containing protein [Thalassovita sp.]